MTTMKKQTHSKRNFVKTDRRLDVLMNLIGWMVWCWLDKTLTYNLKDKNVTLLTTTRNF